MILRAYRVELDPNDRQRTAFVRHAGAVRFVYNWGLATLTKDYAERKAATPEGEKVKGALRPLDLQARLPALKVERPWLAEVTAQSLQMSVRNLDRAFQGFFRRVKAGQTPGYPKFKKRGVSKPSFQFPNVKSSLPLSERLYVCDCCGYAQDRDVNAALNLRGWGMTYLAGGTPVTARGGNVRPGAIRADSVETRTDQGTAP